MDILRPAVADQLVHRPAHEVQPRLVKPRAQLIGAADPDHDGSAVRHVPEPLLTFPQRLFAALPIRDVAGNRRHPDDLAIAVSDRRISHYDGEAPAALTH